MSKEYKRTHSIEGEVQHYGGILAKDSFEGSHRWKNITDMAAAKVNIVDYRPATAGGCLELSNDSDPPVDGKYVVAYLDFNISREDYVSAKLMYKLGTEANIKKVLFEVEYRNYAYDIRFGIMIDVVNDRLYYMNDENDYILIEDVDAKQDVGVWNKFELVGDLGEAKYRYVEMLGRRIDLSDKPVFQETNVAGVKGILNVYLYQEGTTGRANMYIDEVLLSGE